MGKALVVFWCLFLCVIPSGRGAETLAIRVAVEANWPPMEYRDESGEIVGFSVDYVNAVAREVGATVTYVSMPWETIFTGLLDGAYDMVASSVSITPERKEKLDFSIPYYDVRQAVVTPVDSGLRKRGDLPDSRIGVQVATTGQCAAETFGVAGAVPFETVGEAFASLEEGGVDCVIADDPVATNYILQQRDGSPRMRIAFFLASETPEYYGFAVNKGNTRLLELLNQGIRKVQEKGIDGDLRRKWIGF